MRLLVLLVILVPILGLYCENPQRVGWISFETFSSLDHIAVVFERINPSLTKINETHTINSVSYSLNNFYISAWYDDAKQEESYLDVLSSRVKCGKLAISFEFSYEISGGKNGTAYGITVADNITFDKRLHGNNWSLAWDLIDIDPITLSQTLVIQNSSPALSSEDKKILQNIINNKSDKQSHLISKTLKELNDFTQYTLRTFLKAQHIVVLGNQEYTYKNVTVTYTNRIVENKLVNTDEFKGLIYACQFEIEGYTNDCAAMPENYNKEYKGFQELIAFPWFGANLLYIAKKGFFTTTVTSKDWDTSLFQFYMGDFANVIDEAKKSIPSTPVTGKCEWDSSKQSLTIVDYFSVDSIFAQIPLSCSFQTANTTIQKLSFNLAVSLYLRLAKTYLSVVIKTVECLSIVWTPQGNYTVTDKDLAKYYLKNLTSSKLLGQTVFGNQYETSERSHPALVLKRDYVVMYDGSQE